MIRLLFYQGNIHKRRPMRRYLTRLVIINALICALFGLLFAAPVGQPAAGLVIGLLFGVTTGLLVEIIFRRWQGRWLHRRRMLFLVLREVLLLLYLVMPAYLVYFNLRPARLAVGAIPDELAQDAEEVTLQTSDGISLSGWYIPPQNGAAIIALHGLGSNRMGVLPHALLLREQGYGVLMMDMRAHGASGGEIFAEGWNAPLDMRAMVEYLQARPEVQHIGALGLSAGAVSILRGGAAHEAVEAFIAEGTGVGAADDLLDPLTPHLAVAGLLVPDYWISYRFAELFTGQKAGPSLREQVKHIAPRPILFIAGEESMWEPELAAKYAASAGASAEVWVVSGAAHIAGVRTAPAEYTARVGGFLGASLLEG